MQTTQQRTDSFIEECRQRANQYSHYPQLSSRTNERLVVALLHDGNETTCPTLQSWRITWQEVTVGGRYELRKIDGQGATNEHRDVTVLALFPIGSAAA